MNKIKTMTNQFRDWGMDIVKIKKKEYIFIPTQPYIDGQAKLVISLDLCDCDTESIVESVTISLHEILKGEKNIMKRYTKILVKKYKAKIV